METKKTLKQFLDQRGNQSVITDYLEIKGNETTVHGPVFIE